MKQFVVAIDNKLTGEKGVLGFLPLIEGKPVPKDAADCAMLFPVSIGARARRFDIVLADSVEALEAKFGKEIR
jgi:hypothetical protein